MIFTRAAYYQEKYRFVMKNFKTIRFQDLILLCSIVITFVKGIKYDWSFLLTTKTGFCRKRIEPRITFIEFVEIIF